VSGARKWAGGKELIMELDDSRLKLLDPDNSANVIHSERIEQIRVWGVGKTNARDFAYVARDPNDRHRFLCHVFRCDNPARVIASALQDVCSRRLAGSGRPISLGSSFARRRVIKESPVPTPMDEPKRMFRCHFIGVTQVPRATGMHVLNDAVDRLISQVGVEKWVPVEVQIAPSSISVYDLNGQPITNCRVRYLSFLGIGRDIKHCAFIVQTPAENFMCYVFQVEPNAGAMAKTIEAACKLRYQKVLDAHLSGKGPQGERHFSANATLY